MTDEKEIKQISLVFESPISFNEYELIADIEEILAKYKGSIRLRGKHIKSIEK